MAVEAFVYEEPWEDHSEPEPRKIAWNSEKPHCEVNGPCGEGLGCCCEHLREYLEMTKPAHSVS